MNKHAWIAGALCAALATGAWAEEDVTKHPGYVDFGALNMFGKEDTTAEVYLDQAIIGMLGALDPELKALVGGLKQIRVQSFAIDPGKLEDLEAKTTDISKKLESLGWTVMVKVRDRKKECQTYVYIRMKDNKPQGLAVMNVEPKNEATFLNIVGEIDPEQWVKVAHKMHISGLDSLDFDMRGRDRDRDRERGHDDRDRKR